MPLCLRENNYKSGPKNQWTVGIWFIFSDCWIQVLVLPKLDDRCLEPGLNLMNKPFITGEEQSTDIAVSKSLNK